MATFHQALTLGGPTGTSPVLDPLVVLRLHNPLYIDGCRSVDRLQLLLDSHKAHGPPLGQANLPQAGFELGSLGPQAGALPIEPPLLVFFVQDNLSWLSGPT